MPSEDIDSSGGFAVVGSHLRKEYATGAARFCALDDVDLVVPRGQFLCVMGPSGSGKSTLLHVLAGLLRPDAGTVRIGTREIHALSDRDSARFRRRHIGLIFQFFNLIPTLTVEENIALSLLLEGKRLATLRGEIATLARLLGIEAQLSRYPASLSGGEMQRVAIARALLAEPDLVLADEPTGNLDSKHGEEVLSHLRRICDERGVTMILVTHDLRASSYADRVVVLRDGRIEDDLPAHRQGRQR
ncbi:MAG: ABC transporter ATP-binding protein [Proteobacteria bacterium]|nr:ABC transporter ATP-binding protein [Pseudomonadota bacterium]